MLLFIHFGLDSNPANSALILYVLGIVALLFSAVFKRPAVGVYFLAPLLPLQTVRYRLHELPLGAQLTDVLLLGIFVGIWRSGHPIFAKTPVTKVFLVFMAFSYLSLWGGALYLGTGFPFWFDDPRLSDWKNYMVIFLVFFAVLGAIRTPRQVKILLFLMALSLLVLNRTYINTVGSRDLSAFSDQVRDDGIMGYCGPNGVAAFEAQIGAFLLALFCVHRKPLYRIGYLAALGTCLYSLMLTLSRGGYMAFLAAATFIGILRNRKILLVLVLFLATWQLIVPGAVRDRIFMTQEGGELDHSAQVRVDLWHDAFDMLKTDPVFGTGIFTYYYSTHLGDYRDTHNVYVKVLLETGAVGLFLYLTIFRRMFSIGFALFGTSEEGDFSAGLGFGLAALMIAAGVANFFGDRWTYIEITGYTMTIVAVVIRLQTLGGDGESDREKSVTTDELSRVYEIEPLQT